VTGPRATLEILSPGALSSIQDLGRHGFRRFGVPRSGALDPAALRIANALAGADDGAPAIELFLLGPTLRVAAGELRVGLAGDFAAEVERGGIARAVGSWRSVTLGPGDVLRIGPVRTGKVGYVAVPELGIDRVLASASTYLRGGFGGLGGRTLHAGDVLVAAIRPGGSDVALAAAPPRRTSPIRAVPGPQDDHFAADVVERFFGGEYEVTHASDRMGMRLEGPRLLHRDAASAEIVSDATVPGAIQVPGNGLPIVLLADGQTTGGYPKIATVASADLPRLATLPPGARVRFMRASVEEAEALAREAEAELQAILAAIRPLARPRALEPEAILCADVSGGAVDALRDPFTPTKRGHLVDISWSLRKRDHPPRSAPGNPSKEETT
jgi:5-oxoprolinase (ATP-hydrolysing) subunit C